MTSDTTYIELLRMAHESLDSKDKQIAELDKINEILNSLMLSGERRGVEKATIAYKYKIAELEKEKASHVPVLAWIARECNQVDGVMLHRFKSYLEILKLEQQAKGANEVIEQVFGHTETLTCEAIDWREQLLRNVEQIKNQAKTLKEQE